MSDETGVVIDDSIPIDDVEDHTIKTDEPAAEPAKKAKPKGRGVLSVDHEYTSQYLDTQIDDIDTYEAVRRSEVEETLAYFDQVRHPLSAQLTDAILIMEGKKGDPYIGLRLPEHIGAASLTELQELVAKLSNAYMTYAEYLSAARAMLTMRENLYERRKSRASINEGGNEVERKGLASMRSEPEFLAKTKVEMLHRWVETRYFAFKSMMEAAQQVLTTKSVEASRAKQDAETRTW